MLCRSAPPIHKRIVRVCRACGKTSTAVSTEPEAMRSTCFIAAAAALSCADAFCFTPTRMSSGDVLAPFQAGNALKVRGTPRSATLVDVENNVAEKEQAATLNLLKEKAGRGGVDADAHTSLTARVHIPPQVPFVLQRVFFSDPCSAPMMNAIARQVRRSPLICTKYYNLR